MKVIQSGLLLHERDWVFATLRMLERHNMGASAPPLRIHSHTKALLLRLEDIGDNEKWKTTRVERQERSTLQRIWSHSKNLPVVVDWDKRTQIPCSPALATDAPPTLQYIFVNVVQDEVSPEVVGETAMELLMDRAANCFALRVGGKTPPLS